jgi:hypothetical protein
MATATVDSSWESERMDFFGLVIKNHDGGHCIAQSQQDVVNFLLYFEVGAW